MIKRIAFLFTILISLATLVSAQSGGVKGKVKAPNGKGIPNTAIVLYQDGKQIRNTAADSRGEFKIVGLSEGKYNLTFDANGYSSGTLHGVEVGKGVRDLGDRLVLSLDRGNFVIVQGSVFFKEGSSATAAKVELEQVNADGSTKSLGSAFSNTSGEFSFRRRPGVAKLRVTAKLKDVSASKEIEVDEAAIYRIALTLPMSRDER